MNRQASVDSQFLFLSLDNLALNLHPDLGVELPCRHEQSTVINNLEGGRVKEMEKNHQFATEVATEIVATATTEFINAAENAASINEKSQQKKMGSEMVEHPTKVIIIDGEEQEVIIAHSEYDMEQPKDKRKLMEKIDVNQLPKCFYHLTTPNIFWREGLSLFDEKGNRIEEETENVLVFCPTGDSFWRERLEEKLEYVEILPFESVQEYAKAVGRANLYSRGLSNIEKLGVAALATADEACKTVYEFAKENKLNVTTAKLYLDYKVKPADIQSMTMGVTEEARPELGRTKVEAQALLEKATEKFGKNALKRNVIRVVNSLLHSNEDYSLEQLKNAIGLVTEVELEKIKDANSAEKEPVISNILTRKLLKGNEIEEAA